MIEVFGFEDFFKIGFAGEKTDALLLEADAPLPVHKAGVPADGTGVERIEIVCGIAVLREELGPALFLLLNQRVKSLLTSCFS